MGSRPNPLFSVQETEGDRSRRGLIWPHRLSEAQQVPPSQDPHSDYPWGVLNHQRLTQDSPTPDFLGSPALILDSATCSLPSPRLPPPWGRAHMRMRRQSRRSRVLTTASTMATSTTTAMGPDFAARKRLWMKSPAGPQSCVLPLPLGNWRSSSRPYCITGFRSHLPSPLTLPCPSVVAQKIKGLSWNSSK